VAPDLDDKLIQTHRATAILSVAMIASVLVYAGVVEILPRLAPASEPDIAPATVELLRKLFRGLALVNFVGAAWLGGRPQRPAGEPLARLAKLKALTTVGLALAESIALYGLVLFLLSRDSMDFYSLFLVSLLSFILVFPRRNRWREALTEMPMRP
jgi:F0F1-type ATP synthase membrane subunit c/vacuolar-type H+-ATPase subunit K